MFNIFINVICRYEELNLVLPGRVLYEFHLNTTDEVVMYPLGDGNFTTNDSYCPPLDDRYSVQTNDDIWDAWYWYSDPPSTETFQVLHPYNNYTLPPHLWLFPGVVQE
jgi:hypothetical protein